MVKIRKKTKNIDLKKEQKRKIIKYKSFFVIIE